MEECSWRGMGRFVGYTKDTDGDREASRLCFRATDGVLTRPFFLLESKSSPPLFVLLTKF
jgi:hypothetical protein